MPNIDSLRIYGDSRMPVTRPSGHRVVAKLIANNAIELVIPEGATIATFSANGEFYVGYDQIITVPTATDATGNAPDYSPAQRHIAGYSSMTVVAPSDTTLQVSFWRS